MKNLILSITSKILEFLTPPRQVTSHIEGNRMIIRDIGDYDVDTCTSCGETFPIEELSDGICDDCMFMVIMND